MASEAELLALASACEMASGPNIALEQAIALAVYGAEATDVTGITVIDGIAWRVPAYTASLDAAKTLIPAGWWWSTGDCSVSADASCGPDVAHCSKDMRVRFDDGILIDQPSTPALALCSVALRARAATMGGSDD